MKQYLFNIPLLKSKILFEFSEGEYKKNREPEIADYFIFVQNDSNSLNTDIIKNIEDVLFHLYKKKDKTQEETDLKYKAYYKKYNTYIRQENKLPLYINNSIVIFEELYNFIISEYEKKLTQSENTHPSFDLSQIEEVSLDINEPLIPGEFSHHENNQEINTEQKNHNKHSDSRNEEEYDSSFLFDEDEKISVNDLKESMGIHHEDDFDSDSEIPDFPMEKPDKNKSRFTSESVTITKDDENGEFLLSGLLDQAGFDKTKDKK